MNWSRAKTTLIIAFLLLDIVLGAKLWLVQKAASVDATTSKEIADNVSEILQRTYNISVSCEVPLEVPRADKRKVKRASDGVDELLGEVKLSTQTMMQLRKVVDGTSDRIFFERAIKSEMESLAGLDLKDAVLDWNSPTSVDGNLYTILLNQKMGFAVHGLSGYTRLWVDKDGAIKKIDHIWLEEVESWIQNLWRNITNKHDYGILSATQALLRFASDEGEISGEGLDIERIELVYYGYDEQKMNEVIYLELTPMWCLYVNDKTGRSSRIYLNAYDGSREEPALHSTSNK